MTVLLVTLGAAVGAPARYLTDRLVRRLHRSVLPWGTLTVNVLGCFALGCLAGSTAGPAWQAALGIGFCGAYTTYSTFAVDVLELARYRRPLTALAYAGGSVLLAVAALLVGLSVTT